MCHVKTDRRRGLRRTISLAAWLAAPSLALAQAAAETSPTAPTVQTVVVTARDPAGLLERRPSDTVFGLSKPLLETPRSASFVSAATLERYGVQSINDLVDVSPGAFTDSYYGVPGALNLRGTLAETYFRGFKRIENRGTYPTPIGAAEEIEIVRGPPTPVYGPGKVGGFLNFVPKTARVASGYLTQPTGSVSVTLGAYNQKQVTGQAALPVKAGPVDGGVYAYAEVEDDHSFYRGVYPKHQLLQLSSDFDLGDGWRTSFGGMLYHSSGTVQTPGWNRVTQALIDNGTYLAGRNTALIDADRNGRLTPNEIGPGGLIQGYFGFPPPTDPRFVLDTGVGVTRLSPRTVFISGRDFSRTVTRTGYADLVKDVTTGQTLKLQVFYDDLSNQRFVSYGFPADYRAWVLETRVSYELKRDLGELRTDTLIGAGVRHYDGEQKESFNGGNFSVDRRDLSVGATPTDIFDDPFSAEPGGIGLTWETDVRSRWNDAGLFGETDLDWRTLHLTAGGRYDDYRVVSRDQGTIVFGAAQGQTYRAGKGDWTWNASLSWTAPFGLMPYVTYADAAALELGQAGGVAPQLIVGRDWLSHSNLRELGVKLRLWRDVLTGSVALYRQTRTQLGFNNAVAGTIGKGAELELRWLATRNLSFTFAGNLQRTTIKGPDTSFMLIPPAIAGVSPVNGYGGAYAVFAFSQIRPGDYTNSLIPRSTASLYGVYTTDRHGWGRAGATAGVTYVSDMRSTIPGVFRLPSYALANLSGFVERGDWRVSANVDNLFGQRYFVPDADVLANVAVLPGVGRTWRVTVSRSF